MVSLWTTYCTTRCMNFRFSTYAAFSTVVAFDRSTWVVLLRRSDNSCSVVFFGYISIRTSATVLAVVCVPSHNQEQAVPHVAWHADLRSVICVASRRGQRIPRSVLFFMAEPFVSHLFLVLAFPTTMDSFPLHSQLAGHCMLTDTAVHMSGGFWHCWISNCTNNPWKVCTLL